MQLPGRSYASGTQYRYGFNGKELDKEVTQYDYGFRIYDPRLGRFLSVDPLAAKYPFYTPFSFAGNKPIQCIDLDGAEEAIPYIQLAAFDRIAGSTPGVSYVRGKKEDKLAGSMPDERGTFQQFLESLSPIQMAPIEPASHISQAVNFGNSVGSIVYDYDEEQKGGLKSITNRSNAFEAGKNTVYVSILGYSEVGHAIIENLRTAHGLKQLSNAEIADYISSVKIKFEAGKDYSHLFWKQEGGIPEVQFSQIRPVAIPIPGTIPIPILLPPLGGSSRVNTKAGSISVSTDAISQEMAAILAPSLLQMAHKKKLSQSSGSTTQGGARATTHQHGETHGSLSSKKGNKPNKNKRKGAENRGGKTN